MLGITRPENNYLSAVVLGIIVYIVIWLIQFIFNIIYLYSKRDKNVLTRHVVEIQAEALYEETKYSKSYHYWGGIYKFIRLPGSVTVYVTKNAAHIIPVRAFKSPHEMDEFVSSIRNKLSEARQQAG